MTLMNTKTDMHIAEGSRTAEQRVEARCQSWGYTTNKVLEVPSLKEKRSDFRIARGSEQWTVEVKSRHGDKKREQAAKNGLPVEYESSPHTEPVGRFHPMRGFRKAAAQLAATRQPDELAAVWFVVGADPSDELNADEVTSALLGSRKLMDFLTGLTTEIYEVYKPEFGSEVDVVVFEYPSGGKMLLNPWSPRLAMARSSHFITHCAVHDPRAELEAGRSILAPSFSEARRLGELRLARSNTDATIDRFEGRRQREWHVQLALEELGLPPMLEEKFFAFRQIVDDT